NIDDDEPGRGMLLKPLDELVEATIVKPRPLRLDEQPGRWLVLSEQHPQPALQPPRIVLQGQVQHLALLDRDLPEPEAARCNRDPQAQCEPALAELRRPGEEPKPFRDEPVNGAAWLRQHNRE